jgi:hypothetical protein
MILKASTDKLLTSQEAIADWTLEAEEDATSRCYGAKKHISRMQVYSNF